MKIVSLALVLATSLVSLKALAITDAVRINPFEYSTLVKALPGASAAKLIAPGARAELASPVLYVFRLDRSLESIAAGNDASLRITQPESMIDSTMDDGEFLSKIVPKLTPAINLPTLLPSDPAGRLFVLVVFPAGMGCAPCDESKLALGDRVRTHKQDRALVVEFDMAVAAGF